MWSGNPAAAASQRGPTSVRSGPFQAYLLSPQKHFSRNYLQSSLLHQFFSLHQIILISTQTCCLISHLIKMSPDPLSQSRYDPISMLSVAAKLFPKNCLCSSNFFLELIHLILHLRHSKKNISIKFLPATSNISKPMDSSQSLS